MEIRKIARAIELERKKADYELKRSIGLEAEEVRTEPVSIEIIYPNQERMEEIAKALGAFEPAQLMEALKTRSGEAYELLRKRKRIVESNYDNRYEIAKLSALASGMSEGERGLLRSAVRRGVLEEPLGVSSLDGASRRRLARSLRRCGIGCVASEDMLCPGTDEEEVSLRIDNRKVWVSREASGALESNLKRIEVLGSQLQVRNAKRHIMEFSDEEEETYASIQREYLDLLKKNDEILRNEEAA